MPTTNEEARAIVEISSKYMPVERLLPLFVELDRQVGKRSENDSVKQSFAMFRELIEGYVHSMKQGETVASGSERVKLLILFFGLWAFHTLLIIGNIASFFVAPFYGEWYLAFPACFAIIWVTCSDANCTLTEWENNLRAKLGWRRIRGFIGHYFLKPIYQWRGSRTLPTLGDYFGPLFSS